LLNIAFQLQRTNEGGGGDFAARKGQEKKTSPRVALIREPKGRETAATCICGFKMRGGLINSNSERDTRGRKAEPPEVKKIVAVRSTKSKGYTDRMTEVG